MLIELIDEAATLKLGKEIAKSWPGGPMTIHLEGELGAGKTTLTRGLLVALGHTGKVKSPTYTLVEQYEIASRIVYHFDLYRLTDPEELDYIGLNDYLGGNALCIFEWPQQGGDYLPMPDLIIKLHYKNPGRQVTLTALSNSAQPIYQHLKQLYIGK